MEANTARAEKLGLNYWPFVESTKGGRARAPGPAGKRACLVVTDDYPCLHRPRTVGGAGRQERGPGHRHRLQLRRPPSLLGAGLRRGPPAPPHPQGLRRGLAPPRVEDTRGSPTPLAARGRALRRLAGEGRRGVVDSPAPRRQRPSRRRDPGRAPPGRKRLRGSSRARLQGYAEQRSPPGPPSRATPAASAPDLHFGHLSIEEAVEGALATTAEAGHPEELRIHNRGKREGFFCDDPDVNSFLDEA